MRALLSLALTSRRRRQPARARDASGRWGEREEEVHEALEDLHAVGCRIVTLGQYLQPTRKNRPVDRFVEPAEFDRLAEKAAAIGFTAVASGPMVRSSYRAEELLEDYRNALTA